MNIAAWFASFFQPSIPTVATPIPRPPPVCPRELEVIVARACGLPDDAVRIYMASPRVVWGIEVKCERGTISSDRLIDPNPETGALLYHCETWIIVSLESDDRSHRPFIENMIAKTAVPFAQRLNVR